MVTNRNHLRFAYDQRLALTELDGPAGPHPQEYLTPISIQAFTQLPMDEPLVYKFSVSSPIFNSRLTYLSLPPPESEVDSKCPGTRFDFYTPWFFEPVR